MTLSLGRLFLIASIVLVVFAIIGEAASSQKFLTVDYIEWFFASFLSYLVSILFGDYAPWGTRQPVARQPVA